MNTPSSEVNPRDRGRAGRRQFAYQPPVRSRLNDGFYAAFCSIGLGVLTSVVVGAPWGYATAALTVIAAPWAIRRVSRIRLLVTEDEVRVVNYWRSYVIPWSDVVAVAMMAKGSKFLLFPAGGEPALAFWRRGGGKVLAQATPSGEREHEEFQSAVMALAPAWVERLTPPPDWWAVQDKHADRRRAARKGPRAPE